MYVPPLSLLSLPSPLLPPTSSSSLLTFLLPPSTLSYLLFHLVFRSPYVLFSISCSFPLSLSPFLLSAHFSLLSPPPQADALKEKSSSRIRLILEVQAPVVLIPLSASSSSALILDLGLIKVKNTFILARSLVGEGLDEARFTSSEGHPAIIDQMNISVSSIQLGRAINVHKDYRKDLANHMIVKPLLFDGVVNRSLSPWCAQVPTIDIRTNLESIEVRLCILHIYKPVHTCTLHNNSHINITTNYCIH